MAGPTYGELIKMLEDAEFEAKTKPTCSAADILAAKFGRKYPNITTNRPDRLFDSISRIAAPTRPSTVGPSKLNGSPLQSYVKRRWVPKTKNTQGIRLSVCAW